MHSKMLIFISTILFYTSYALAEQPPSIARQMQQAIAELNNPADTQPSANLGLQAGSGKEKSRRLAVLLSLALPGAGEYYLGEKGRAKVFFGAEAATWAGYYGYKKVASWRREEVDAYALEHAGVDVSGRDDTFLQIVKRYPRSENLPNLSGSYNEIVRRDARNFYPNDLEKQREYAEANYLTGADAFTWDTRENWDYYKVLLHQQRNANKRAFYISGFALFNRITSMIDTIWIGRKYKNVKVSDKVGLEFDGNLLMQQAQVTMKVQY